MVFAESLIGGTALHAAIDRQPLTVSRSTPLLDVIEQMSRVTGHVCSVPMGGDGEIVDRLISAVSPFPAQWTEPSPRPSSCVLVMDGDRAVGIFTERDIVRLVAHNIDLSTLTIEDVMTSPVISLMESDLKDVFAPLFLFRRYNIRHLLVVDDRDRPVGLVSAGSLRATLRPASLLKLRRVSDVMAQNIICADQMGTVLQAAKLMAHNYVSCVVITENDADRGPLPVGILTERDIVQFKTLGLNLATLTAKTVMSTPLALLDPSDSLWTAHQEMQRLRVRRLVVSWNWGKGLGLITQTSLLRVFDPLEMYSVLESLQDTVQQLQSAVDPDPVPASPPQPSSEQPMTATCPHSGVTPPPPPTAAPPVTPSPPPIPAMMAQNPSYDEAALDRLYASLTQLSAHLAKLAPADAAPLRQDCVIAIQSLQRLKDSLTPTPATAGSPSVRFVPPVFPTTDRG